MFDFKKEHIKKAGYSLFLATTCGILGEKTHLPELGAAWAIGSVALEGFFHTLRDFFVINGAHKISEGLPSKLNEDLEKAIKAAYQKTIDDLMNECIIQCELDEPFFSRVNNFIRYEKSATKLARERLDNDFFKPLLGALCDENEVLKFLEKNSFLNPDEYLRKIIAAKALIFYDEEGAPNFEEFVDFVSAKFKEHFKIHFHTELKNDDRAKTVYFATVIESILNLSVGHKDELRKITSHLIIQDNDLIQSFSKVFILQNEIKNSIYELEKRIDVKHQPFLSYNDESENQDSGTLFSYKQKYTTVVGRNAEISLLQDFLDDKDIFSWLLITGSGGIGKSRLALEISEIARKENFYSGFLNDFKNFHWESWTASFPTFIIIDYAFANYKDVSNLIKILRYKTQQIKLENKVRIILLDRELREEWKKEMELDEAIRSTNFLKFKTQPVIELKPISEEYGWEIIREIIYKSSLEPGIKKSLTESKDEIKTKFAELDSQQRPLFAFFTGVALTQKGDLKDINNWNVNRLIEHHLDRLEFYVWKKHDNFNIDHSFNIKVLLAIATLCRNIDKVELGIICKHFSITKAEESTFVSIAEKIKGKNDKLNYAGIQPDILGEYFILKFFAEIFAKTLEDKINVRSILSLARKINPKDTALMLILAHIDYWETFSLGISNSEYDKFDEMAELFSDPIEMIEGSTDESCNDIGLKIVALGSYCLHKDKDIGKYIFALNKLGSKHPDFEIVFYYFQLALITEDCEKASKVNVEDALTKWDFVLTLYQMFDSIAKSVSEFEKIYILDTPTGYLHRATFSIVLSPIYIDDLDESIFKNVIDIVKSKYPEGEFLNDLILKFCATMLRDEEIFCKQFWKTILMQINEDFDLMLISHKLVESTKDIINVAPEKFSNFEHYWSIILSVKSTFPKNQYLGMSISTIALSFVAVSLQIRQVNSAEFHFSILRDLYQDFSDNYSVICFNALTSREIGRYYTENRNDRAAYYYSYFDKVVEENPQHTDEINKMISESPLF